MPHPFPCDVCRDRVGILIFGPGSEHFAVAVGSSGEAEEFSAKHGRSLPPPPEDLVDPMVNVRDERRSNETDRNQTMGFRFAMV